MNPPAQPKKSNTGLVLGILGVLGAAAGVGAAVAAGRKSAPRAGIGRRPPKACNTPCGR